MTPPIALERLCVFCGSSRGARPVYAEAARSMGRAMAAAGLGMVYGGGRVGLMGVVADEILAAGGDVIGIIPESLATDEIVHPDVSELRIVPDMHARKTMMHAEADALIALPGGFGTLEEILEAITWAQLGIHTKPLGLLNVAGYFDPLIRMFERGVQEQFIRETHVGLFVNSADPLGLLEGLRTYERPSMQGRPREAAE